MKSKFLFIYADKKENIPSENELIKKLKCSEVIKLSDNHAKLRKQYEKTNFCLDSLEGIYSLTCGKWFDYAQQAWGINCADSHKSVFYVANDAKSAELTFDVLKEKFFFKTFLLDEDEFESVEKLIGAVNKISKGINRSYIAYKYDRQNIIETISDEKFKKYEEIFKEIELQEQRFLDDCKLFSDVLIGRMADHLNHDWI
jgi:hypothetical protein